MRICILICLGFGALSIQSAHAQTATWICVPKHWINLRAVGPTANEGNEPPFVLKITTDEMSASGDESWMNGSVYTIDLEVTLGSSDWLEGSNDGNSQFVFNKTSGEFFHSSTHPGVAVSMVGQCASDSN